MKLQQLPVFLFITTLSSASPLNFQRRGDSQYPASDEVPDISLTPQSWTDALNSAKSAGKIPDFSPSTNNNGDISYSDNVGSDPDLCSWTISKCYGAHDIYTAPKNVIGISFDDGPTEASSDLYNFLSSNNQSSTHFLLGSNVLDYSDAIQQAAEGGNQQFAVHTWSHPYLTTLSDEQIVAELGWTMQVIFDYTGLVPNTMRPPYGDTDNRVRAIAENVFGLITILWNEDSNDWCTNPDGSSSCPGEDPGETEDSISNALQTFIQESNRTEGLIILEHELTSYSVNHFKTYYPQLEGLAWVPKSIPDMSETSWYSNSVDGKSPTTDQTDMVVSNSTSPQALQVPEQVNQATSKTSFSAVASTTFGSQQDQTSGGAQSTKESFTIYLIFATVFAICLLELV